MGRAHRHWAPEAAQPSPRGGGRVKPDTPCYGIGRRFAHTFDCGVGAAGMNAELRARFPEAAYIDPTARVYGRVEIGSGSSLWPYAVIRAEGSHVRIGRCTNLQDHAM